jgi:transposase
MRSENYDSVGIYGCRVIGDRYRVLAKDLGDIGGKEEMLNLPPSTRVYLCNQPVDMRKSYDGLSGLVQTYFGQNPLCGHVFVFLSKRKDHMKVLTWHLDGFVLYCKRLERGTFSWMDSIGIDNEISASDFALLLTGLNTTVGQRKRRIEQAVELSATSNLETIQP